MRTPAPTAGDDRAAVVTLPRSGAKPLRVRAQALITCETRAGATRAIVTVWEREGAGLAVSAVVTGPRAATTEHAVKLESLDDLPEAARLFDLGAGSRSLAAPAARRSRGPRVDVVVARLCERIEHEQARRAIVAALALTAERLG